MTTRRILITVLAAMIGYSPGLAAGSLSFSDVIKQLPNSLDWQSADLSYQSAQRSLDSARAAAGLKVTAGADGSLNVPLTGTNPSSSSASVNANASLTVLPWSSTYDAVRTQERALYRAGLERSNTRNTLALNAALQYFSARTASLDLQNAQASENLSTQQLSIAERQFQNGQITQDSLSLNRKNLENAHLNTLQAQQNSELTRLQLYQTLGLAPSDDTLSTAASLRELPAAALETLIATSLPRRWDVLEAQSRVQDAQDSLQNAQRDRWLPNANLSASVGNGASGVGGSSLTGSLNLGQGTVSVSGQTALTGSSTQATSLTVSASLSVPVVNPSGDARIDAAIASLESAKKALQSAQQSAALDIRQKYNDAQLQTKKVEYNRSLLQNAQSTLAVTQKRFELGSVTALDVTQAQLAVQQAARDLEAQLASQLLSVYRLENALGTLALVKGDNP